VATSAYLVWYSQELKMYSLVALMGAGSTALLVQALRWGGARRWTAYVATTALMPYVHVLGVLLIPAHAAGYLLAWPRRRPRMRAFALSLAILLLPYAPLAAWQAPLLLNAFQTGHPYYPLTDMLNIVCRGWTLGIVASADPRLMLPFAFALAGLALTPRLDPPVRFVVGWTVIPFVLVHLISLRSPIFTDRYLIASVTAFLLLSALGIERLGRASRVLAAFLLAAVLAVQLHAVKQQSSYSIKTDTRSVARIAGRRWQNGDVFVLQIPYLSYSMEYYLDGEYPLLEGPYTNHGMSPSEVAQYMELSTRGYDRVWLVLSEAEMWDARGLTEAWLRDSAVVLDEWELARVRLLLAVRNE